MGKRILPLILTITYFICLLIGPKAVEAGLEFNKSWSPFSLLSVKHLDHQAGQCTVIKDQNEQVITETSRQVVVGDEIILPDGRHYRVKKVGDAVATAKLVGFDKQYLGWVEYFYSNPAIPAAAHWSDKPVGIYHTHTGESYVPTSGKAFKPYEGDIYQVGRSFGSDLEKQKVNVIYYHTPHDPHDSNAYMRSRRTAMGIMKDDPVAIFDIHRDGVPDANKYRTTIDGQQVAKVRLVIGKQNPASATNKDFAKRLMAYAERVHPGIIKDLYIGRGNYNQDLLPTSVLLEAGTHTNTLAECQQGMALFAEAVPVVLGLNEVKEGTAAGATEATPIKETEKSGWSTALWLVAITVVAVAAFIFINTGTMEKALETAANTIREMLGKQPRLQQRVNKIKSVIAKNIGPQPQSKPIPKQNDKEK